MAVINVKKKTKVRKAENGKHWFDVTLTERYSCTYKVLAEDESEACDIIDNAVNTSEIDAATDDPNSYDRETDAWQGEAPEDGDIIVENEDDYD